MKSRSGATLGLAMLLGLWAAASAPVRAEDSSAPQS